MPFKKIAKAVKSIAGPALSAGSAFLPGAWGQAASAVGGFLTQRAGQVSANQMNRAAAERQYEMQTDAYKHRYQWQMEDMRRAGLNPLLAYQQGAPGGPAGASYQAQNVNAGALDAVQTGYQAAKTSQERKVMASTIDRLNQDIRTSKAEEINKTADTDLKKMQTYESLHRQKQIVETAEKIMAETKIVEQNLASAKAAAAAAKHDEAFFNSDFGRLMRDIDRIGQSVNPFATSAKNVKGATR